MHLKINFTNTNNNFHQTLTERVDAYFKESDSTTKANWLMRFKTFFFLIGLITVYLFLILQPFNTFVTLLLFAALGLFIAFVGINISHDAIHGAYSKKKWVNKLMSLPFNMIGASAYMWKITHNIVHHSFTNISGHDEDIEIVPILRLSPHQPYKKMMRFQHIYAFGLYSLSSLSWVFIKDYKKFFTPTIGNYDNRHHEKKEYFYLFFYKLMYYIIFIALPFIFIQLAWWKILLGFIILHLVEGLTLAVIFVLAHVVEGPEFPEPDEEGGLMHNWASHQLMTTSDFCRHNRFVSFFCGGLNFQIEHHLFPKICHTHYRNISEIVKTTALEYDLPYHDQKTFFGSVASHIRLLKKFGQPVV